MQHTNTLASVLSRRYSRRDFLKRSAVIGGGLAATTALSPLAYAARNETGFIGLVHGHSPYHRLAENYRAQVLLRWGDPLFEDMPDVSPTNLSPESQAQRFGMNCDFLAYFPMTENTGSHRGLLCINHEYPNRELMFDKGTDPLHAARVEMAALGVSVVEINTEASDEWQVNRNSPYTRRITATTPLNLSGPAAGNKRLKTHSDPSGINVLGTFANCAGGQTPWGTYLTAEENFNFYFSGKLPSGHSEADNYSALGIGRKDRLNWGDVAPRFNLSKEPNEANRFGWIVEINPFDPASTPIKRTALGRFKHECATFAKTADGRAVIYSGDDEAFQYLYRFISRDKIRAGNSRANANLLDHGVLSAARFDENGTLKWLPLVFGHGPLTKKNGFTSQADVVIEARRAAKLLGATAMDRPEDVGVNPLNQHVFVVMTGNPERKIPNAANARTHNKYGHILELLPADGDHGANVFRWELFLAASPATEGKAGWLTNPDNLAFDSDGNCWVATDGIEKTTGFCDGLYHVPTTKKQGLEAKLLFSGPTGAEITGPCFTPDDKTLFLSVQHPGEGSDYAQPSTRWPDFSDTLPPRPSVIAIRHKDPTKKIGD